MKNKKIKIIFAGTPEFSVPTLALIDREGFKIELVLTQPDRKSGRGMNLTSSAVKQKAQELEIPIFQPDNLNTDEVFNKIKDIGADILVVAAYGLIIPRQILDIFIKGSYNVHASLLPKWRGAAPIHRAIEAGDSKTGVTIMSIAPELDTGDMICKKSINLKKEMNTGDLTKMISNLGAELMISLIKDLEDNKIIKGTKQDESMATYANKVNKSEGKAIWSKEKTIEVIRKINAFNPFPGLFCNYKGKVLKIWKASEANFKDRGKPGTLFIDLEEVNLYIGTADGSIKIEEIQLEGKKRMTPKEFIISNNIKGGELLI